MDLAPFLQSIQEARREAAALDVRIAELQKLSQQRRVLEQYITYTEALILGDNAAPAGGLEPLFRGHVPDSLIPPVEPDTEMRQDRLWKVCEMILQMQKRPMSAADVLAEIDKTDHSAVQGEHRRETVRGAMLRKDDIFERVGRGMFALQEWPERLKALPDAEPADKEAA